MRTAPAGAWHRLEIPFGDELNDLDDLAGGLVGDPRFAEEESLGDDRWTGFGSEVDTGQLRLAMAPEDEAMNSVVLDPRGLPAPGLAALDESPSAPPPPPPPPPPATVDEAAAAVLLAHAFHRRDGLLRAMWRGAERASEEGRLGTSPSGMAPSVLLRLPDMSLSGTLWRAVRAGVLGVHRPLGATSLLANAPRPIPERAAVGLVRDPGERRVTLRSAGDDDLVETLSRALAIGVPVVVTLPADETELIGRVAPLVHHDLHLPAFTPAVVGAIVELVTRPAEALHPFGRGRMLAVDERKMDKEVRPRRPSPLRGLPTDVTLQDLRVSVHAGRGRRGSIARLRRIARARHEGTGGSVTAKKDIRAAAEGADGGGDRWPAAGAPGGLRRGEGDRPADRRRPQGLRRGPRAVVGDRSRTGAGWAARHGEDDLCQSARALCGSSVLRWLLRGVAETRPPW